MTWHEVEQAEIERLCDDIGEAIDRLPGWVTYRRRTLPFYQSGHLIEIRGRNCLLRAMRSDEGETIPMTGQRQALIMAGIRCGLTVTRETVAAYLTFFCANLAVEGGNFEILEALPPGLRLERPLRPEAVPVKLGSRMDGRDFRLVGHCLYKGNVSRCGFRVNRRGDVVMKIDRAFGPLFPVH